MSIEGKVQKSGALLFAGITAAVTGMTWLILSIISYGAPPQPTLIPVENNSSNNTIQLDSTTNSPPSFPTLSSLEVQQKTQGAVSNSGYGIKVQFLRSENGFSRLGIGPVNSKGEGPPPMQNALFLSATKVDLYHHDTILCGPDGICIEANAGGLLSADPSNQMDPGLYFFYPLNDVKWQPGDAVHVWMLLSIGGAGGNSQWVDLGKVTIEQCINDQRCPSN